MGHEERRKAFGCLGAEGVRYIEMRHGIGGIGERFVISADLFQSGCQAFRIASDEGAGGIGQVFPFSRDGELYEGGDDRRKDDEDDTDDH